ncbi:MAG: acyl-CoA/acyl-ACP dehydrogenase [Myxococcales bacterium]|nr:acyl-CoA/acyl-ACP dehydrogenase [Myxococcales bacterium]
MDFNLTEEQQDVQELSRKILEDLLTNERLKAFEASGNPFHREVWSELAKANLLGVAIGETYDGSDMGFFSLCVLLEEIGRSVAPVPLLPTLVLGALPLEKFGNDVQKQRWLPGVVRGETLLTAALQEEGHDDPTQPRTTARPEGDEWRLSGRKICVPAAEGSAAVLVPARTEAGSVAAFWVDPMANGVELTPQTVTHRQPHFLLELDGAVGERLGTDENGAELLRWLADRATTAVCAVQVGVSDRVLQMTAEYSGTRMQFERPIGSFQAVHMRAADAFIHLEGMRLTMWDAAWRLDADETAHDTVVIAKYWAAEGGQFVGYAAQHLHGGIGIDVDYPLHRYYLWAKQNELTLGSAAVQVETLGAGLADGSLTSPA